MRWSGPYVRGRSLSFVSSEGGPQLFGPYSSKENHEHLKAHKPEEEKDKVVLSCGCDPMDHLMDSFRSVVRVMGGTREVAKAVKKGGGVEAYVKLAVDSGVEEIEEMQTELEDRKKKIECLRSGRFRDFLKSYLGM